MAGRLNLAQTVAMAFAVSASTFAPLLVLGIWWPGLTVRGAVADLRPVIKDLQSPGSGGILSNTVLVRSIFVC